MKRKLSMVIILCLTAAMLVACAEVGGVEEVQAPARLVIAARGGSHVDVLEAVKNEFETANNVTIEILGLEAADLRRNVSLDSQNPNGAFDLAMADDPWMPEWSEAGIFANLSELGYEADSDFVKASLDIGRHPYGQGDLFALPFAGNVQLLFYNKDVLEAANATIPESWEDVLDIAKSVNGIDGMLGYVIRGQQGNPIVTDFLPILWAFGGDVFNEDWEITIDTPEAKEALNLYMALLANGANFERNDIVAAVSGGTAAMSLGWPSWYISGDGAAAEYALIPSKANASSTAYSTGMIGNWMMGVTANSANKDLALKFLEYVTSADVQRKAAELGGVPTRTSVFTDSELIAKFPHFETILIATENSVIRPRTPLWSDIETAFGIELSNAISGIKTVDQALADARIAIERIMNNE